MEETEEYYLEYTKNPEYKAPRKQPKENGLLLLTQRISLGK